MKPRSNLNEEQRQRALALRGMLPVDEIANEIRASRSGVCRLGQELGLSFAVRAKYKLNPELVREVCEYYEQNGRTRTQERFPEVNVRSLIEKYKDFSPRQIKWTDEELVELARMAGVISIKGQARFFNRPRAHEGAIVSAWQKRFGIGGGCVNGLPWGLARHFVNQGCAPLEVKYWRQRKKGDEDQVDDDGGRRLVSWVELKRHLKKDSPSWLKECADVMAGFQIWLHGTTEVGLRIGDLIREREL